MTAPLIAPKASLPHDITPRERERLSEIASKLEIFIQAAYRQSPTDLYLAGRTNGQPKRYVLGCLGVPDPPLQFVGKEMIDTGPFHRLPSYLGIIVVHDEDILRKEASDIGEHFPDYWSFLREIHSINRQAQRKAHEQPHS